MASTHSTDKDPRLFLSQCLPSDAPTASTGNKAGEVAETLQTSVSSSGQNSANPPKHATSSTGNATR